MKNVKADHQRSMKIILVKELKRTIGLEETRGQKMYFLRILDEEKKKNDACDS